MNRHVLKYYFAEGVRGIFLHGFSSFAAIGVITACLIIMGSFSLVAVNVRTAIAELEQQNEILVILEKDLTEAAAKSVGTKISAMDNVRDRIYDSREDVLLQMTEKLGAEYMEGISPDVVVPQYRVYLEDIALAPETTRKLEGLTGVDEVKSAEREMAGFVSVRQIAEIVSVALIALLLVISLFIMSNTIKLATFDRREEIGIMRVVGATKGFIRWPFVVEGFLLGILSGVIAFFIEWLAYNRFAGILADKFGGVMTLMPFQEIRLLLLLVFVLTGFLVGIGGSVMAIRKYLRA